MCNVRKLAEKRLKMLFLNLNLQMDKDGMVTPEYPLPHQLCGRKCDKTHLTHCTDTSIGISNKVKHTNLSP